MPQEVLLAIVAVATLVVVLLAAGLALGRARRAGGTAERRGRRTNDGARSTETALGPADVVRLTDAAGLGLLRVDGTGTIVGANAAAHEFLGRRPGTLVGLSVIAAFLDHRIESLLRDAQERGSAELDLVSSGEPPRTLLVRAERGAAGDDRWLLVTDVSELRRLQRIRAEFVDNLSHELRTPLTTVRLLSEVLSSEAERSELPPRVRDAIAKIDVETGHLAQMVAELLDLARIEQGETRLRREAVDLRRVAETAIERLRAHAERQGMRLRAEIDAPQEATTISGDAERLGQLVVNLLDNAVKFSRGGGEVVVAVRPGEGGDVVLEVADQGVGIPRAELERIFERFYKVDRARARAGAGGTGLGLAIARHIAEGHGGRIWAESEEGSGARFFVALPRRAQGQ